MKKPFWLLVLVFISLLSCKETTVEPAIVGWWTWKQSVGGIAGTTETPASTGKNKSIEFRADHTVRWYEGSTQVRQSTYTLTKEKSSISGKEVDMLTFADQTIKQSYAINNNTLTLEEECIDCYNITYDKVLSE